MKKLIPYFQRRAVKVGITILWAILRCIHALLGVFATWLNTKRKNPF